MGWILVFCFLVRDNPSVEALVELGPRTPVAPQLGLTAADEDEESKATEDASAFLFQGQLGRLDGAVTDRFWTAWPFGQRGDVFLILGCDSREPQLLRWLWGHLFRGFQQIPLTVGVWVFRAGLTELLVCESNTWDEKNALSPGTPWRTPNGFWWPASRMVRMGSTPFDGFLVIGIAARLLGFVTLECAGNLRKKWPVIIRPEFIYIFCVWCDQLIFQFGSIMLQHPFKCRRSLYSLNSHLKRLCLWLAYTIGL